ncbi:hypothetical protein B5F14_09785 [Faecalitalea cylindroides]|uniref:Uncharacterized protein n=1 Tax=Faecalitalea cylindroides TaxID=39483 RepID=A0A1Y4LHW9_9FIRM|nr:oligosaccharide flippase family protein [Faecalitalea cylindroides]OUP56314.1 hypothetical protein B5F14_09785 [Faecalitalea cylindroides]
MNESKRLIKNTGIIALGNLSTKLVSFFLLPLYTALLTTSEYGTVDYITSISLFCTPCITVLMEEAMFRFLIDCDTDESKSRVISTSLVIVTMGSLTFFSIAIPILFIVKYEYTIYLVLYIITLALNEMLSALLRGLGRMDQFALYNFLTGSFQVVLNVVFIAFFRWGIIGMLLASIIARMVISMLYIVKLRVWDYIDFKNLKRSEKIDMIKYSIPLIPNKLSWTIIKLSSRIIITNTLGSSVNGIYAVAYKFPDLMDTIYGFFYQSWKESSARVKKNGGVEVFYNYIYINLKNFMFSIVLGMTAFMPLVFRILINESYFDAIFYVPILLLGTYFSNISGFYGGIFTAYKDTKIMGNTTIVGAVLNLFIVIIGINEFGLYAASFAVFLSNFIICIYRKIRVKKYVFLKKSMHQDVLSIIVLALVFGCFYSMSFSIQVIGALIAIIYAFYVNKNLIMIIFEEFKKYRN